MIFDVIETVISRKLSTSYFPQTLYGLDEAFSKARNLFQSVIVDHKSTSFKIIGPSGSGKTAIIEHALRTTHILFPDSPFLVCRIPCDNKSITPNIAMRNICEICGCSVSPSTSDTMLRSILQAALLDKNAIPLIIILDSFDYLSKTSTGQYFAYELVNMLHDPSIMACVVAVCENTMISDELERRTESRFTGRPILTIPKFDIDKSDISSSKDSASDYALSIIPDYDSIPLKRHHSSTIPSDSIQPLTKESERDGGETNNSDHDDEKYSLGLPSSEMTLSSSELFSLRIGCPALVSRCLLTKTECAIILQKCMADVKSVGDTFSSKRRSSKTIETAIETLFSCWNASICDFFGVSHQVYQPHILISSESSKKSNRGSKKKGKGGSRGTRSSSKKCPFSTNRVEYTTSGSIMDEIVVKLSTKTPLASGVELLCQFCEVGEESVGKFLHLGGCFVRKIFSSLRHHIVLGPIIDTAVCASEHDRCSELKFLLERNDSIPTLFSPSVLLSSLSSAIVSLTSFPPSSISSLLFHLSSFQLIVLIVVCKLEYGPILLQEAASPLSTSIFGNEKDQYTPSLGSFHSSHHSIGSPLISTVISQIGLVLSTIQGIHVESKIYQGKKDEMPPKWCSEALILTTIEELVDLGFLVGNIEERRMDQKIRELEGSKQIGSVKSRNSISSILPPQVLAQYLSHDKNRPHWMTIVGE
ncbi:Origin recognition complex subunit 4 like protein [Aduncisulcus paluster]|uniref:Origin recognition complex subunit 4 like protein n=1 Tax=Aduncisulcus paluster TaxID=2918883 RepID=A0ABQ5K0F8_9EUKA|nr:Origin recognition complex subunit 4 like protein [Aduncisulcus paluster]